MAYKLIFDWRKNNGGNIAIVEANFSKFAILAVISTTDIIATKYMCLLDLSTNTLYIEEVTNRSIGMIQRGNFIDLADLKRIESDEEWNSVFKFVNESGIFDAFTNKSINKIRGDS